MAKPGMVSGAVLLLSAALAWAQPTDMPALSFEGFGTVGVVHSDEERADFVANSLVVPEGAGHTSEWSAEVDSRLGLQASARLTPEWSAVGQVVVEQQHDDHQGPEVDWANIKYQPIPEFSVRAGRVALPLFLASEYRKVGYANPWVRPPREVYGLVPVSNIDGIDALYQTRLHDFTNTVRLTYGRKDADLATGGELESRRDLTLSNRLERDGLTLYAAWSQFRLTAPQLEPLFDAFRRFGADGRALAERYGVDDKRFEVVNVGARYAPGPWFLMGEWAHFESRTYFGDRRGWYITGGYRLGEFTPYVTLARRAADSETSTQGLTGDPVVNGVDLNARLNQLLGSAPEQRRVALGTRWDFARNAALKLQYEHLDLAAGSAGVLINEQPGFRRGGDVDLFSATIDFVF